MLPVPLTAAGGNFLNDVVSAVDAWAPIPGLEPPPGADDPTMMARAAAASRNFPSELFPEVPPELRFTHGDGKNRRPGDGDYDEEDEAKMAAETRERRRRLKVFALVVLLHDVLLCILAVWWSANSDYFVWLFGSDAGEYNSRPFKKAVTSTAWGDGAAVPGVNVTAVRYYAGFTRGDRLVVAPPSPLGIAALGLYGDVAANVVGGGGAVVPARAPAVVAVDGATGGVTIDATAEGMKNGTVFGVGTTVNFTAVPRAGVNPAVSMAVLGGNGMGGTAALSAPGAYGALKVDVGGGGTSIASSGKVYVAGSARNVSDAISLRATGPGGGVSITAPGGVSTASSSTGAGAAANFTVRHTDGGGVISGSAGRISLLAPLGDAGLEGKTVSCAAEVGVKLTGLRGTMRVGATAATAATPNSGGVSLIGSDAPIVASTTGMGGTITVSAADAKVEVSSSQPIAEAVKLTASNGGIGLTGGGNAGIKLTTTVGPIALAAAGRASGFSLEADDNDNHLTFALLKKTGNAATRAQLKMEADGVTADAISLNAKDTNGGVSIQAGTAGAGSLQVQTGIGGVTLTTSGQGRVVATNGVSLRSTGGSVTAEAGLATGSNPPPVKLSLTNDGKLTVAGTGASVIGVSGADLSLTVGGGSLHKLSATSTGTINVEAAGAGLEAVKIATTSTSGGVKISASGVNGEVETIATGTQGKVSARASGTNGEVELAAGSSGKLTISLGLTKRLVVLPGGIGVGRQDATYPIHMASGAYVTAGGIWTDASSRALKTNVTELTTDDAVTTLSRLNPVSFRYLAAPEGETTLGFIAEDVPDAVAQPGRKGLSAMPVVAVLSKVVQGQEARIARLEAALEKMQRLCGGSLGVTGGDGEGGDGDSYGGGIASR